MVGTPPPNRDKAASHQGGPMVAVRPPLGITTVVAIIAPGLVVFALPAVGLISRNPEFFRGDLSAGRDLYLWALLAIAGGLALWVASRWTLGRFLWICYLLVTPGWLVYTVLGGWDRVFAGGLVVIGVLAIAWVVLRGDRFEWIRTIALSSALILVGTSILTALEVRTGSSDPAAARDVDTRVAGQTVESTEDPPNIYHVVLDEFQTEMFEVTLDDEVRGSLSGFTYYPETRTSYGRTEMSMATVLGSSDYDYETSPQEYVDASLRGPDSSLRELREAGYRITGFHT